MLTWTRRVLLSVLPLVVLAISAGSMYERSARRDVAGEYPPPGDLVEYDGESSHLFCTGEGSPTVVLEAGLGVTGALAYLPRTVPWGFSGELAARDAMSEQAAATGDLGDRPLVVLTAGAEPDLPGVSEDTRERVSDIRTELRIELAALSTHSVRRTVKDAGHDVPSDAPEAVVAAVRDVVRAVRKGTPIGGDGDPQS